MWVGYINTRMAHVCVRFIVSIYKGILILQTLCACVCLLKYSIERDKYQPHGENQTHLQEIN